MRNAYKIAGMWNADAPATIPAMKTETAPAIIKAARKAALASLNQNRAERGLPPLARIERLWWRNYGPEWIARAKQEACK